MSEIDDARKAKRAAADKKINRFYEQYDSDINHWELDRPDHLFLKRISNGQLDGRALMSNRHVRQAAQYALIDAFLDHFDTYPDQPRYFVTLAWDMGVTMEREPKFDLVALRNVAQAHLRRAGLQGVGAVEIDTWKNLTGEPGRRMVGHIHFLGWPVNPIAFDRDDTEKELKASRALQNSLGVPGVVIKTVGQTAMDIAHLGMYILKIPAAAKNRIPHADGYVLRPAQHAGGSAARLVEIFSHIEVGDVLFSILDGKTIASAVRSKIRDAVRARSKSCEAPSRAEAFRHWRRIRLVNGSRNFQEPTVVVRAADRQRHNG